MKGGAIKRNRGFERFNSLKILMDLVNNPNCVIRNVSYKSLFGFIFTLNIPTVDDTPYLDIDGTAITTFILKLTILGGERGTIFYPGFIDLSMEEFNKAAETESSFTEEATKQANIYNKSIDRGDPICPCIINTSIFNNELSLTFLNRLMEMKREFENNFFNQRNYQYKMLDYIKSTIQSSTTYKLGCILMENNRGYKTVGHFEDTGQFYNQDFEESVYNKLVFLILRLYYETKCIHIDIHLDNVMMKPYTDNTIDMRLIDFGMVLNAPNALATPIADVATVTLSAALAKTVKNIIFKSRTLTKETLKTDFNSIINTIDRRNSIIIKYYTTYKYKADFDRVLELFQNYATKEKADNIQLSSDASVYHPKLSDLVKPPAPAPAPAPAPKLVEEIKTEAKEVEEVETKKSENKMLTLEERFNLHFGAIYNQIHEYYEGIKNRGDIQLDSGGGKKMIKKTIKKRLRVKKNKRKKTRSRR